MLIGSCVLGCQHIYTIRHTVRRIHTPLPSFLQQSSLGVSQASHFWQLCRIKLGSLRMGLSLRNFSHILNTHTRFILPLPPHNNLIYLATHEECTIQAALQLMPHTSAMLRDCQLRPIVHGCSNTKLTIPVAAQSQNERRDTGPGDSSSPPYMPTGLSWRWKGQKTAPGHSQKGVKSPLHRRGRPHKAGSSFCGWTPGSENIKVKAHYRLFIKVHWRPSPLSDNAEIGSTKLHTPTTFHFSATLISGP